MGDKTLSLEDKLSELRNMGATQGDTVNAIMAVMDLSRQEADHIVLTSQTWKNDNKRSDFFDSLDDEFE